MKKLFFISFYTLWVCCGLIAQSSAKSASGYMQVDKKPEFPGGMEALVKILTDGVDVPYPSVRREDGDDEVRKIILTFYIDETGKVSDVLVVKSMSKELDPKYVALVQKLKFKPALLGGKPVKVKYTLPFSIDFGFRNSY